MGRMTFVLRRLLQLVPVAIGCTIVVFFMIHLIPGDPAVTILGIHATPRAVALLHKEWGLNRPLISQYWLFMDRLLHGNLGVSLYYGGSALSLIISHLPPTVWLITYSSVLAVLISVPLAMIAASRKDGARDHVVRAVPLLGLGMPQFWLAFLLIYAFAIKFHWFPVSGWGTGFFGHLRSMFLPSLTVALALAPVVIRSLRATVLGINIGFLIGGTVIIENVFAIPGLGQLLINSIFQRDFTVVQGLALVFAIMVILLNLAADVAYASLDPRVRFSR